MFAPMLAAAADDLPTGTGWTYEPKWDGFRVVATVDGEAVRLISRDGKPLERYFPELVPAVRAALPDGTTVDGEIVLPIGGRLDFDALQTRIHPAASRVAKLAVEVPTRVVLFDLLAVDGRPMVDQPLESRRKRLASTTTDGPTVRLTPWTEDPEVAADWFRRFEGSGLDGVVAKRADQPYLPGKRGWVKVKKDRTTEVVVAGFRWHKGGDGVEVGSLLVGLFDADGVFHQVGGVSGFSREARRALAATIAPLRLPDGAPHPWRVASDDAVRRPGAPSRWRSSDDGSWCALAPERVVEVRFNQLTGGRFRHPATLVRWREDREPASCRVDQLPAVPAEELGRLFGA